MLQETKVRIGTLHRKRLRCQGLFIFKDFGWHSCANGSTKYS